MAGPQTYRPPLTSQYMLQSTFRRAHASQEKAGQEGRPCDCPGGDAAGCHAEFTVQRHDAGHSRHRPRDRRSALEPQLPRQRRL
jgi:hypothetical protein